MEDGRRGLGSGLWLFEASPGDPREARMSSPSDDLIGRIGDGSIIGCRDFALFFKLDNTIAEIDVNYKSKTYYISRFSFFEQFVRIKPQSFKKMVIASKNIFLYKNSKGVRNS